MKIGVAAELNCDLLERAKALGISALVFHRIQSGVTPQMLSQFELHDTSKLTHEGKQYAFTKVEKQLLDLQTKVPSLLNYKAYNLQQALHKDMYWSLIIDNLNEQKCKELGAHGVKFIGLDKKQSRIYSYFKFFVKLFRPILKIKEIRNSFEVQGKIAVRINSLRALPFFGNLLGTLGSSSFVCFQSQSNQEANVKKGLADLNFHQADFISQPSIAWKEIKGAILSLFYQDIYFLNLVWDTKQKLIWSTDTFEALAKAGATAFLLNAGENEGEGVLAGWVAESFGIKAFNFMNGTKAKDPINQFTTFQFWFMHDVRMQKMFLEFSNQKVENLPVVGHLLEDIAQNHSYSGTLDKWKAQLKDKKVIALFSSIIYNKERSDVAQFLHHFLDTHLDVIVLVRQHPSETQQVAYTHPRSIVLPDFKELSGAALFDLMQAAHIAISFGSTVSLQASWFGVPSATVEYAEKSLLLYVDQEKVHHFNSIDSLEPFIVNALAKSKTIVNKQIPQKLVAQKMTELLLQ